MKFVREKFSINALPVNRTTQRYKKDGTHKRWQNIAELGVRYDITLWGIFPGANIKVGDFFSFPELGTFIVSMKNSVSGQVKLLQVKLEYRPFFKFSSSSNTMECLFEGLAKLE